MRRRIKGQPPKVAVRQELMDHKEATLNVLLSKIPEIATFADIGELVGYSYEWVRQRVTKSPHKLFKMGKRYKVPRGVAEEFVRSVLN